ncbi:hypothetical protein SAMN05444266_1047 [Chitinophaga jiangningensis]|uniref:PAS domain-containing protein n=1 Tax=Chitinophaga jiangningensis TaxID=1419482 RepID=A0A1M7BR75_9BACT|nr:hypothetical protein [Chitinophaga jiangningensis]SHL57079.1 hypothetical protein SAMN05444266_1047 [Chitinophaga jiangningensis]
MTSWDSKALSFINQTSRWDKEKHIGSFLTFSINLLRTLLHANITLQIEFQDEFTARVKNAYPEYLEDMVLDPEPIKKMLYSNAFKTIYWPAIPPPNHNVLKDLLQAFSSSVIIPLHTEPANSMILLGWSEPVEMTAAFQECIETMRIRLKEIITHSQQHSHFQRVAARFSAIMHAMPHAIIFINNDGYSGWVNQPAAELLELSGAGEQLPAILSDAMMQLRSRATNAEEIYQEAMQLFSSPANVITNWEWKFDYPTEKKYNVICMPVSSQQVSGRLWIFEAV